MSRKMTVVKGFIKLVMVVSLMSSVYVHLKRQREITEGQWRIEEILKVVSNCLQGIRTATSHTEDRVMWLTIGDHDLKKQIHYTFVKWIPKRQTKFFSRHVGYLKSLWYRSRHWQQVNKALSFVWAYIFLLWQLEVLE